MSSHHPSYIKLPDKRRTSQAFASDAPPLYDLQEVIQQYQSQPELLKLILTSKVEEDKRRAEEAKLRAKELDLYFHHNNQPPSPTGSPPTTPRLDLEEDEDDESDQVQRKRHRKNRNLSSAKKARTSVSYTIPSPTSANDMASSVSSLSSASSISSLSSEDEDMDQHQQRRHSAAAAMLAMGGGVSHLEQPAHDDIHEYPSPDTELVDSDERDDNKPRRRREMQAITKIVETREFPYVDNYFWKNNGNTVQKKTGCKSIYYKCSNSNKGCTVNKTVTARPNGEYLIKYRGCHLPECGRVERIRDL
ncbi:hypothetical protein EDC96DRAFT_27116 [Choanephora cucurbitarum]|nr:hypothetical protein EDC96DRAFT_27116 [Choanephora cucurbitarum]